MKTVLMIAFHFPPLVGTSGVQRTLRFAQHLPSLGWKPVVLTVNPSVYETVDDRTTAEIPPACDVVRVPCLDTARHLAFRGRYWGAMSVPDRWVSWHWFVRAMASRTASACGADVIWSTYPIATAHMIGASMAARSAVPWVADFRDPMAQEGYPADPRRWRAFKRIEERAVRNASRLVFVAPSALDLYQRRYPDVPSSRFTLIENGYDEAPFQAIGDRSPPPRGARPLVLLHSGVVYPSERDPSALFGALSDLKRSGRIKPGEVVIRFRAPTHVDLIERLASQLDVNDLIEVAPPVPYHEALAEMMTSDALVVMQGSNCNEQIPAKLYEYFRAGRPLLGLADPAGDTARTMARYGISSIARLESKEDLAVTLDRFIVDLKKNDARPPTPELVPESSRRKLTERLADVLNDVCTPR